MLEDYIYEFVHNYIENEINYIQGSLNENDIDDLYMLKHMTENKKMEIAEKIVEDSNLEDKINELIYYYLYEKDGE